MKKTIILLAVLASLASLAFTTINTDQVTITDKYRLYKDAEVIFEHTNRAKIIDSASNTKKMYPNSDVRYTQPTTIVNVGEGGKVIAVIESESFNIKYALKVNKSTATIFGSDCDATTPSLLIVSDEDFDFKNQPITLKNCIWYVHYKLLNNGEEITIEEATNQGLIIKKCTKSKVFSQDEN